MAAAPHNALILVEPGRYDGQVVARAKAVTIRAAVPGGAPVLLENRDAAPAVYCDGAEVTLQGVALRTWSSDAPATVATLGGILTLESCTVTGQATNALLAEQGEAYLRGCHVHGMRRGVAFVDAQGVVEHCRLWDVDEYALLSKRDSFPIIRHCHVQDVGHGFEAFEGGRGAVEDCQFTDVRQAALVVSSRSRPSVRQCRISGSRGSGLKFSGSAGGLVEDCELMDLAGCGIEVSDSAEPDIRRCLIERVGRNGIYVSASRGTYADCTVTASRMPAIAAVDGAVPQVTGGVLRDVRGDAVLVRAAAGRYDNLQIEAPGRYGVRVQGGDPSFTDLLVTGGEAGIVLDSDLVADVRIEGATVRDAAHTGIAAEGPGRLTGTRVRVENSLTGVIGAETVSIDLTDSTVSGGEIGLAGTGQASLLLDQSEVIGTTGPAVLVQDQSRLTMRTSTVRHCGSDGVQVETDAPVLVDRCEFVDVTGEPVRGVDRPLVSVIAPPQASPKRPASGDSATDTDGISDDTGRDRSGRPRDRSEAESTDVDAVLAELDAMIGLAAVKREVRTLAQLIKVGQQRRKANLPVLPVSRHLVFTGPPGTGKTTVARIYGRLLAHLGLLSKGQVVEVARVDLVGEYLGSTALKTAAVFKRALGGVLFVDEAYTLARQFGTNSDLGLEAIDTLVKLIEDNRDQIVVIVAGYPSEMTQFLAANPGLASRFTKTIEFADYTPDELLAIVSGLAAQHGYDLKQPTNDALLDYLAEASSDPDFGNGRGARKLFGAMVERQAERLADISAPTAEQLRLLLPEDLPPTGS